jgi:hypothetical protein
MRAAGAVPRPAIVLAAALGLGTVALAAAPGDLGRFVGTYVGVAEETDTDPPSRRQRDIDLVISAEAHGGLQIAWSDVTLVDGRRDVPGVERRVDQVRLVPAADRDFYLAREAYDPFTERHPPNPLGGDPLRWATVAGDSLRVYSLVILDDARYELQTYDRTLTPDGLRLDWQRTVDGEVVRRATGHAVRAE